MWLELICSICNVFIFHQHILMIVCQPSLNMINNYLICVVGKQWEAPRFTIKVCTCMVLCLKAHYCAIAGIILIFRFLTIWSCTCRSCCLRCTIEVCTCMVLCLIAHYCEIAGTILIFRFLTIWSCTCRSCATS